MNSSVGERHFRIRRICYQLFDWLTDIRHSQPSSVNCPPNVSSSNYTRKYHTFSLRSAWHRCSLLFIMSNRKVHGKHIRIVAVILRDGGAGCRGAGQTQARRSASSVCGAKTEYCRTLDKNALTRANLNYQCRTRVTKPIFCSVFYPNREREN